MYIFSGSEETPESILILKVTFPRCHLVTSFQILIYRKHGTLNHRDKRRPTCMAIYAELSSVLATWDGTHTKAQCEHHPHGHLDRQLFIIPFPTRCLSHGWRVALFFPYERNTEQVRMPALVGPFFWPSPFWPLDDFFLVFFC